ncbi:MAG: hypothetical protein JWO06_63, partial [Bacteroidota bacterium]|nr:hypothetical protein [Bacteroidota bacterium]
TSGAVGNIQKLTSGTAANTPIDNTNYAYFLQANMATATFPSLVLYKVVITYTVLKVD